jgi:hypothetical protein
MAPKGKAALPSEAVGDAVSSIPETWHLRSLVTCFSQPRHTDWSAFDVFQPANIHLCCAS